MALLPVVNGESQDHEPDAPRRFRRGGRTRPTQNALDSVTTDSDGRFLFDHIPSGKYSLQGSHRGFLSASYQEHGFYSTAIVTGPGLPSEGLTLKLSAGAVINGSVTDTAGDPIEQASVSLYRLSDDGLGNIRMYRSTDADDLGAYEFAHLPPGTYFVSATARVWYARGASNFTQTADGAMIPAAANNLDVVYPRAYYADASDSDAATPIPARGGDHLRIDLHMQAVPAVHLTYTLPANGSRDPRAFAHPLNVTQSVFGTRDSATSESLTLGSSINGNRMTSMSLSVAPGEYEAEVGGRTLSINAAGDTVLDPQAGTPSADVSGRIGAAPGATLPESVDITLEPADSHGNSTLSAIAHDGVFHFDQVHPGAYEVGAQTDGRPMAIVQLAASGAPLNGHLLQVGTQPVTFAATVAPATVILTGFARLPSALQSPETQRAPGDNTQKAFGEATQPASGVMIVLVPKHPGDRALYRRDQSDSDGSFTLRQVAAGAYTLIAIDDGWDLDWARPEVIAHYLPAGLPVTITTANSGITRLSRPVIVQPR